MKLIYFDIHKASHLIEEFFFIKYSETEIPLEAIILPLGFSGLAYIYSNGQKITLNSINTVIKGLVLNGQYYKPYQFKTTEPGFACGLSFNPTALHKLTNLDISKFTNKYTPFNLVNKDLSNKFEEIFKNHNNNFTNLLNNLQEFILELPLIENKNTLAIDKLIDIINSKEGLLSVNELLTEIPFGQKTLETQFKKIVGLTPAKYIRICRFKKLMKQYESNKISLKDLIYMYDYYDESHFARDFKSFTNKSFKDYFKDEFSFIKEIYKNSSYEFLH